MAEREILQFRLESKRYLRDLVSYCAGDLVVNLEAVDEDGVSMYLGQDIRAREYLFLALD